MTEQALEERRKYMREWRRKNPNKQREYSARHWEKRAREAAAQDQQEEARQEA